MKTRKPDTIYFSSSAYKGYENEKQFPLKGGPSLNNVYFTTSDFRKIKAYSHTLKIPKLNGPQIVNKMTAHELAHRGSSYANWDLGNWDPIPTPKGNVIVTEFHKTEWNETVLATYNQTLSYLKVTRWDRKHKHGDDDKFENYNGESGEYIGDRFDISIEINIPNQPQQTLDFTDCWIKKKDSKIPIQLDPSKLSNKTDEFIRIFQNWYRFEEAPDPNRGHGQRLYRNTGGNLALVNLPTDSDKKKGEINNISKPDSLPDIWEDWAGSDWLNPDSFKKYKFLEYMGSDNYPSDMEFYAEFNSQDLEEPDYESDWANPGNYTGKYEEDAE